MSFTIEIPDEAATERLAGALAAVLPRPAVVTLDGPLGAGKTCFVRALAVAAGADPHAVSSPTFVLVHEYEGRWPVYHFDVYRLGRSAEFLDLAPDEYFASPGWSVIEWAERVAEFLPAERLEIRIRPTSATAREFTFVPHGGEYEASLGRLPIKLAAEKWA